MPKTRIPLSQPIESRSASTAKDSRCVNVYFETRDQVKREWINRPGLASVTLTPTLPVAQGQGLFTYNNFLWAFINNTLYKIDTNGITTSFSTFGTTGNLVSVTQTANNAYMFFHNNVNGYYITSAGSAVQLVTSVGFPTDPLVPGTVYLDGYVFVMTTKGAIYNSAIEDPTSWNALNFITAEAEPDKGVAITKHFNYVIAFGEWSTEFFYDAANATGSPLARNDSARLEIGCASGYSVQQLEQTVIWCGQSKSLGRSVYLLEGTAPTKISTRYIEKYLNADTMSNVKSWTYKIDGHTFYGLTLVGSNITLVYDLDEKVWYQWTSQSGGVETYFTPVFFSSYNSKYYFLDNLTGRVFNISTSYLSDAGEHIYKRAVTDIQDSGVDNSKFYRRLIIIGDKVNATLQIRHSDDDYTTFSTYRTVNLLGQRPQLQVLGAAKRRSWEFLCTDDVALRLDAAEISFDIGRLEGSEGGPQQALRR